MSRAYRIQVSESQKRVLRAGDHVSTDLELLEVLPCGQMAELLAGELLRRGFERRGKILTRQAKGVTVEVEPEAGTVTVRAEAAQQVELQADKAGRAYDVTRGGEQLKEALRADLRQQLEQQAQEKTARLQKEVTDRLEAGLGDLRAELDAVVNRVTAEALKRKAAQLGQIKALTEDPETGSMTIVLEV